MGRFQDPGCTIFVKNIETRVTEEHLWELFLQAGPLRNVHIPSDRATGKKRNFAFVTYRDEISVGYACELFHQIRLFKKPIYCSPSNKEGGKPSFNQTPNRSGTPDTPHSPHSPSPNSSLIEGILNRSNSVPSPLTSTPFQGKRKFSQDAKSDGSRIIDLTATRDRSHNDNKSSTRVVVIEDDRDQMRYNNSSERDRGRYSEHDDRDRGRYDNSSDRDRGRYDDSTTYRSNSRDDRDSSIAYNRAESRDDREGSTAYNRAESRDDREGSTGYNRAESREDRDGDRRYDDRSSAQGGRYDRSNSQNSSYGNSGNMSPMHIQVLNQSHTQYGRPNTSPRDTSNFGPMRQDSHRNARRQRSQPY